MEALIALFPSADPSVLQIVLDSCDDNLEVAVETLFDQFPSSSHDATPSPAASQTPAQPSQPILPRNCHVMDLAEQAICTRAVPRARVDQHLPSINTQTFRSVHNGDCAPHAMGMVLAFIVKQLPKTLSEHEFLAHSVRNTILEFLSANWTKRSALSRIPWHELVYFAHNVAIPASERETYADWGQSDLSRKDAWMRERDELYFTTSEFLAFCEMMHQINLPLVFRLWRQDKRRLIHVAQIPENAATGLVFDMKHSGRSDSKNAHWELLRSGSASCASNKRKRNTS